MDHAADLLEDVDLPLVDGDDPEDVLAKGASYASLLEDLDLDESYESSDYSSGGSSDPNSSMESGSPSQLEEEDEEDGQESAHNLPILPESPPQRVTSRRGSEYDTMASASPIRA